MPSFLCVMQPTFSSIPVGQHPDDESYNMSHPNQGIAVIFNNQIFDSPLFKEREGTQKDCDSMEKLMKKFGFYVKIYQDYTVGEIRDALHIGEWVKKKAIKVF